MRPTCDEGGRGASNHTLQGSQRLTSTVKVVRSDFTFQLDGICDADYRRLPESSAPKFRQMPGLLQQVWLGNAESNTYGGVYVWSSREEMERYVEGEVFGELRVNSVIKNLQTRGYEALEAPTAVTFDSLTVAVD